MDFILGGPEPIVLEQIAAVGLRRIGRRAGANNKCLLLFSKYSECAAQWSAGDLDQPRERAVELQD